MARLGLSGDGDSCCSIAFSLTVPLHDLVRREENAQLAGILFHHLPNSQVQLEGSPELWD